MHSCFAISVVRYTVKGLEKALIVSTVLQPLKSNVLMAMLNSFPLVKHPAPLSTFWLQLSLGHSSHRSGNGHGVEAEASGKSLYGPRHHTKTLAVPRPEALAPRRRPSEWLVITLMRRMTSQQLGSDLVQKCDCTHIRIISNMATENEYDRILLRIFL